MARLDLSVEMAGVKFKNPILPGASELAEDVKSVKRMIQAGFGGIVSKSFTSMKAQVKRPRPNNFPIPGHGYSQTGGFLTYSTSHVIVAEECCKKLIPEMVEETHKAGLPFIATFWGIIETDKNGDLKVGSVEDWAKIARGMEKAGADILEANLSCPVVKGPFEENPLIAYDICKGVVNAVKIPVGIKISPAMGPIGKLTKMIVDSGAKFISAHNCGDGMVIDIETGIPFGAPAIGGYIFGRSFLPWSLSRCIQIKQVSDIEICGIGGIYFAEDVIQYMLAGCPTVQVCTSIYLKGSKLTKPIIDGLEDWMVRKGYSKVSDFIGRSVKLVRPGQELKDAAGTWAMPPDTPYVPIVDSTKCKYCGNCTACFKEVYTVSKTKKEIKIDDSQCVSCGMCIGVCPTGALSLVDRATHKEVVWTGKGTAKPYVEMLKAKGLI